MVFHDSWALYELLYVLANNSFILLFERKLPDVVVNKGYFCISYKLLRSFFRGSLFLRIRLFRNRLQAFGVFRRNKMLLLTRCAWGLTSFIRVALKSVDHWWPMLFSWWVDKRVISKIWWLGARKGTAGFTQSFFLEWRPYRLRPVFRCSVIVDNLIFYGSNFLHFILN